MAYSFITPEKTIIGRNSLSGSGDSFRALGTKAFVVTGKTITGTGIAGMFCSLLDEWGIGHVLFNDITGEPTDGMISLGVSEYRYSGCDFIVGLGGGSPMDSAKAIAAMTVLDGKISGYMGKEITGSLPPMAMVPTTAGTGSEATKFTIITDSENDVKMLLKGNALVPDLAVIDASLSDSAPGTVTAATGIDALTHAVESYISLKRNEITDMYALAAVKKIFANLKRAFDDGNDARAREEMAIASYYAGICINNASVTLVHGMSRPIGAMFHVPHGLSNAMLLSDCMEYIKDGCEARFADMARAAGMADGETGDKEASGLFITALSGLIESIGIPRLRDYGLDRTVFEENIGKMAGDAMKSTSPQNTMRYVTKSDLVRIYKGLWA